MFLFLNFFFKTVSLTWRPGKAGLTMAQRPGLATLGLGSAAGFGYYYPRFSDLVCLFSSSAQQPGTIIIYTIIHTSALRPGLLSVTLARRTGSLSLTLTQQMGLEIKKMKIQVYEMPMRNMQNQLIECENICR